MTRARILKLAGGAVLVVIAIDLIATAATAAIGWELLRR
jgi:hypothetical protein